MAPPAELKKDWAPSQKAFRQLLNWLAEGAGSSGEKYLEMHRRLVSYFDRKNCFFAAELADETLNRVARRLEESGPISGMPPARYCYIVARFVFLEYGRRAERASISLDEHPEIARSASEPVSSEPDDSPAMRGRLLDCLDRCMQELRPEDRELIFLYHQGERRAKIEQRRALASRFGLTANALSIRACRIRDKLEACVRTCAAAL